MGEVAKALGQGRTFSYQGIDYIVTPRNLDMIGRFETFLESRARDKIIAHKDEMTAGEYADALGRWEDKCAAGHYSWGGPAAWETRFNPPGLRRMAYLQLAFKNPEVTPDLIDQIADDETKIGPEPEPVKEDRRQTKWGELLTFVTGPLDPNLASPSTRGG